MMCGEREEWLGGLKVRERADTRGENGREEERYGEVSERKKK
jgi:hypothetical protein